MEQIVIYKVHPDQVPAYWPYIRGYLDAALKKHKWDERYPLDHLAMELRSRECTKVVWVAVKDSEDVVCATITDLDEYPNGLAVNVFLTGGEGMHEWGDLLHEALVAYAKSVGAKWIDTSSRRGIGKLFYDRLGYTRKQETYVYEV